MPISALPRESRHQQRQRDTPAAQPTATFIRRRAIPDPFRVAVRHSYELLPRALREGRCRRVGPHVASVPRHHRATGCGMDGWIDVACCFNNFCWRWAGRTAGHKRTSIAALPTARPETDGGKKWTGPHQARPGLASTTDWWDGSTSVPSLLRPRRAQRVCSSSRPVGLCRAPGRARWEARVHQLQRLG